MSTPDTAAENAPAVFRGPLIATDEPMIDFLMEGAITPLQPIHVSSADNARKPDQQGVVVIPSHVAGQPVDLPAIKGETFKGTVRAAATRLTIDIMRVRADSSEMPLDVPGYYRLGIGGVKARGKQRPEDVFLMAQSRARNPMLAVFGGAEPYWATSKIEFGHAVAPDGEAAVEIIGGARRDALERDPTLLAQFSEADQRVWLSYADTNSAMAKRKREVKELERQARALRAEKTEAGKTEYAALAERIKEMKDEIDKAKSGEAVENTVGRPLPAKNALRPGVPLSQRIRGNGLSMLDLGFFMKALEELSDNPRIGGHASRGFGLFAAEWQMRAKVRHGFRRGSWETIGMISLRETEFTLPDHPLIRDAFAAYERMLSDPSIDFGYTV